jgi:hypothetical protein
MVLLPVFSRQCAKARDGKLKFTAARLKRTPRRQLPVRLIVIQLDASFN